MTHFLIGPVPWPLRWMPFAVLVLAGFGLPATAAPYTEQNLPAPVRAAVVEIHTELGRIRGKSSNATGFVAQQPNWVVTNLHAVHTALSELPLYNLKVHGLGDRRLHARVIAVDVAQDLAVLETGLPLPVTPLPLAERPAKVGEQLYAIGITASTGLVVSQGAVVSLDRDWDGEATIRYSGTVKPGMSGGPVLNERGEVAGVNRARYLVGKEEGILVALPAVRRLLEKASRQPYADHEALRQDVRVQHRQWAAAMANAFGGTTSNTEAMGRYRVPSLPMN